MRCSNKAEGGKRKQRISVGQIFLRLAIGLFALLCAIPVALIVIVAFSSEASIAEKGFSYAPLEWSLESFEYVINFGDQIFRAYIVTITETVVGSFLTVFITCMFAYVLSRNDFKLSKFLAKYVAFTTLFSGGLMGAYLVNTNLYGLKNSFWVLVLPTCVTAWNTIVMRTFVRSNVPKEIIESAHIDGANEFYTYFKIVMPLLVPVMASIGFMSAVAHWNEWQPAYLYMDDPKMSTLQLVLIRIEKNIDFLMKNAGTMSAEDVMSLKNIPSESARMAILFFAIAPIMVAYPFFQKYFIKGLTVGSVKG